MQNPYSLPRVVSASAFGAAGLFFSLLATSRMAAEAQSVTAAADGTGTLVNAVETTDGTVFTIDQGSLSADDANLFHSFESFSLDEGDTAHFLAQPSVQNILARISGGAPSIIDGLLQVAGQGAFQPNLFLMNPAGVLFGAEAVLNLPASLTVTTADAVGVGEGWFGAVGDHTYASLLGVPSGEFAFVGERPGSVVNAGNLALTGESAAITLLGGTTVNTGTLSAPGGAITLAAIPGENIVRLSQENSLLSLEMTAVDSGMSASFSGFGLMANSFDDASAMSEFSPLDLPALLTHVEQHHATGLSVGDDGSVRLTSTGSRIPTAMGDVIASGRLSVESAVSEGGQIAVLGDRIGILDAQLLASGAADGGNIRLGGDYQGLGPLPTAERILVDADSAIFADAIAYGDGGRVIVWSDDTTRYAGHTSVRGGQLSGDGGFVEVSGKVNLDFQGSVEASAPQGASGSLLLDPERIIIEGVSESPQDSEIDDGAIFLSEGQGPLPYRISEAALESLNGNIDIRLEASERITLGVLSDNQLLFRPGTGTITFDVTGVDVAGSILPATFATVGPPTTRAEIATNGRDIDIFGTDLTLGNISTAPVGGAIPNSGSITLVASDFDGEPGSVRTGNLVTAGNVLETNGDVVIEATSITTQNIRTGSPLNLSANTTAGDVVLTNNGPFGEITTGDIEVRDYVGGSVLLSPSGSVTTGMIREGDLNEPLSEYAFEDDFLEEDFFPEDDFLGEDDLLFEDSLLDVGDEGVGKTGGRGRRLDREAGEEEEDPEDRFEDPFESFDELEEDIDEETDESLDDFDYGFEFSELELEFVDDILLDVDSANNQDYVDYLGLDLNAKAVTLETIQEMLTNVESQSGVRSAVVYVNAPAATADKQLNSKQLNNKQLTQEIDNRLQAVSDALEIIVVTAEGIPVRAKVSGVTRSQLFQTIEQFRGDIVASARRGSDYYLPGAQQLYQWLIAPIEAELCTTAVESLLFSLDEGLRSLPIAALHDGEQYLVEKYSLGVVPSVSLIDAQYESVADAQVLAMGASSFDTLSPLPAVPLELELINELWSGSAFLNENFTRQNLVEQRSQIPYRVIHLATHAEFQSGAADNSYIQLWDEKLKLSELHQLGWQYPAVDLLVLSACRTAVGSPEAEMGFAGLAIASGVRSAMASLWSVSDVGTLALMSEFYGQLQLTPTKAKALRSAQLSMLKGEVRTQGGDLMRSAARGRLPLPSELGTLGESDFSHPYYWSGFTMIGSPW